MADLPARRREGAAVKITDIRTIQLSYRAANPSMSAASFNAAATR